MWAAGLNGGSRGASHEAEQPPAVDQAQAVGAWRMIEPTPGHTVGEGRAAPSL